jgi:hypothetical protein
VKLVKKILGENEVVSVLQRLDRLSLDEARTTATQTLEVVHGLIQNMRVVMDGETTLSSLTFFIIEHGSLLLRRQGIGRCYLGCSEYVLLVRMTYHACLTR